MALLKSLAGLAAAAVLFMALGRLLPGSALALTAHLALAALAVLTLVLGWRARHLRPALLSFSFGLSALTVLSAVVFPLLIRAEAQETAAGRPFCLVGPEISLREGQPRRYPYRLLAAPSAWGDLTLLTFPRPLTLVVERPSDVPDPVPSGKPDSVFVPFDWTFLGLRFVETEYSQLREPGDSRLVDCAPSPDPFDPSRAKGPAALVVWRDAIPDAAEAWGPRRQALLRLPVEGTPTHDGRFRDATFGVTLSLAPVPGPVPATFGWVPDPAVWLGQRQDEQVRNRDRPLDWAALPVNADGLTAYEVPSTSVADGIDGTYLHPGPDGRPLTVIACDTFLCRHHTRLDPALPVVLTLTYPVDLLPRWEAIAAAAVGEISAAVSPGG